jgi:SpoIID/LytB domain protein
MGSAALCAAVCGVALTTPTIAAAASAQPALPARAGVPILAPAVSRAMPSDTTDVRIAMTENDTADVIVTSSGGVSAPGVTDADAVMFHPVGSGVWTVFTATGCAGPSWQPVDQAAVATPVAAPVTAGDLLTLCAADGTNTEDQGTITGVYNSAGQPRTVNTLPLEEYVADVVPGESPSYWGTLGGAGPQSHAWGFQELEAQAVAVRSYVLADPGGYGGYATTCDLACQDYRGTRYQTSISVSAAQDTAGKVMVMPDGAIATTEYAASTGGYTAGSAESSPFDSVPDAGDGICLTPPPHGYSKTAVCNPNHDWAVTVPLSEVHANWPQEGTTPTVTIKARNGEGTWGGRVTELTIAGNGTQQTVGVWTFVGALSLRSDYFTITSGAGQPLAISGHGWGPGVGMGQWGALGYAVGTDHGQGQWTWEKILAHYYSPATLESLPGGSPSPSTPVTPPPASGSGYWLTDSQGDVFAFGSAPTHGSMGGSHLNQPIVGMAATPTGAGYWLCASDGGIFTFGTAGFLGSMGGTHLNQPIVGMAAAPTGKGYWEVASDGGIFTFGTAGFFGSMGGAHLNQPIVGMAATPTGKGYWEVASDGGIFTFGTAASYGSAVGTSAGDPAAAMMGAAGGYLVVSSTGTVASFGAAKDLGSVSTVDPGYEGEVVAAAEVG